MCLPQIGSHCQQMFFEGASSSSCLKVEHRWAGKRACVWLVICRFSQLMWHFKARTSRFVSTKQVLLHQWLVLNACSTYGCLATLYLMHLPTSRLPAVTVSFCRLAHIHLHMSYARLVFCYWFVPGLYGNDHLCSNDGFDKPELIAGCWAAPELLSGWPGCPIWCLRCV